MKLRVVTNPSIVAVLRQEVAAGERAVTAAFRQASVQLKNNWRGQITRAGLGRKLANSIRSAAYPEREASINAAALVWSNAPRIISANENGTTIRARNGTFLAVPTEAAGKMKGSRGRKITPREWQQRSGVKLRFVRRRGGGAMLVADDQRFSARGLAVTNNRKRRKDGVKTGSSTIPIFILIPQVRLRKRLNLARDAEQVARSIPRLITQNWKDTGQ